MRHNTLFWNIIYFFITTHSLYAMKKQPSDIVTILPPNYTYCCRKHIYHYDSRTIKNLVTHENKTIEEFNKFSMFRIHQDRTKIIAIDSAIEDNAGMQIYDIKQHRIIKSIQPPKQYIFCGITFSQHFNNDFIVNLCHQYGLIYVNIYNYDKDSTYLQNQLCSINTKWILHPKKMILGEILNSGHINTYDYKQCVLKQKSWRSRLKHTPNECIVNHEGLVAINDPTQKIISILHLDNIEKMILELEGPNKKYISMSFYPKGSILTVMIQIMSSQKLYIQYLNILSRNNKECIEIIDLPDKNFSNEFYFSRNGKKIIIPRNDNTSYVYYVPWRVRYTGIKNQLASLWMLAQRHGLPNDITRILMRLIKKY